METGQALAVYLGMGGKPPCSRCGVEDRVWVRDLDNDEILCAACAVHTLDILRMAEMNQVPQPNSRKGFWWEVAGRRVLIECAEDYER
jgi:hypothetical protein